MVPVPASRREALLTAVGPALLAVGVFANTLRAGLLYDDPAALALARAPASVLATHRFGLTYLTIRLEELVWGSWAPGFHLTNLLLHGLCSALAGLAALALTARPQAALLCGLLFAVHPVHVEAVASIENRKDLLAMTFAATSVILYRAGRRPRWAYPAALASFACGMMSKEVAVAGLVGMLPLADILPRPGAVERWRSRLRTAAWRALPLMLLGLVATAWYAGDAISRFSPPCIHSGTVVCGDYDQILATSAGSVPDLARLLVFPARLSADYPARPQRGLLEPRPLAGALLLAAWVTAALLLVRRAPLGAFAMTWTVVMYLPLSNLVPLTPFFVAERYLYVPSFGVCLAVALALERLGAGFLPALRLRLPATVLATVLIVAAAGRSVARTEDWRDGLALWSSALRAVPEGSEQIYRELGLALWRAGRGSEAIPHLRRALELAPGQADLHGDFGLALLEAGRTSEAIGEFRQAFAIWPTNPLVRFNLATTLAQAGEIDEALVHFRELAKDDTWNALPPGVGAALAERGMSAEQLRASIRRWIETTSAKRKEAGP